MLEAFEKATGIHVNFIRFSSGEALARLLAEKGNPQVDVLFGGPVETFTAGEEQGIFEAYTPPSAADLPKRFKSAQGMWTAIADDPLVFMTNSKFLQEHNLQAPASWDDLLNPAYKSMLQMADARTSGTAVTRIFSILQVNNRDEDAGFAYMKKLRQNIQAYTKSGGGGTVPVGLGRRPAASSSSSTRCSPSRRATTSRYRSRRRASARRRNASASSRATRTGRPPRS